MFNNDVRNNNLIFFIRTTKSEDRTRTIVSANRNDSMRSMMNEYSKARSDAPEESTKLRRVTDPKGSVSMVFTRAVLDVSEFMLVKGRH